MNGGPEALDCDTGTPFLLCSIRAGVATITLNRPEAMNALSDQLTPYLRRTIARCRDDEQVRVILLAGAGAAFCAGGDVKAMDSAPASPPLAPSARVEDLKTKQRELTGALRMLDKPTLACITGPAVGAGLSLALACDLRIASTAAFVKTGYLAIGLSGDYGMAAGLVRAVGPARAAEMLLLDQRIGAARCLELGLFHEVVADSGVRERAWQVAQQLAQAPATALAHIKANLRDAMERPFLEALDLEAERMVASATHPAHREAVQRFMQRRRARR